MIRRSRKSGPPSLGVRLDEALQLSVSVRGERCIAELEVACGDHSGAEGRFCHSRW